MYGVYKGRLHFKEHIRSDHNIVLNLLKGWHKKFWGSFYTVA